MTRQLGVPAQTYHRWRKECGRLKTDQAKKPAERAEERVKEPNRDRRGGGPATDPGERYTSESMLDQLTDSAPTPDPST